MDAPDRDGTIETRDVVAAHAGRIDAIVADACPDLSRARVQRLLAAGFVARNGSPARKSEQVAPGDVLTVSLPATEHARPDVAFDLPVLFEDELLAAIDKPPGLAVHGAPGEQGPTVAAWWLARLGEPASAFDAEHPGVVHRLDKDTSGVLLLAKTPAAQAALSAAFEARTAKKTYLAVTDGAPDKPHAVIDAPIARHPGDRMRMSIVKKGRAARTEYEVLAADRDQAFLVVRPETGRTHQIRVHLAAIGAAVAGDRVYGTAGEGRQLLHAWQLRIPHPGGGLLTVTAPMPANMLAAVRTLGGEAVALPYTTPLPATLEPAPAGDDVTDEDA